MKQYRIVCDDDEHQCGDVYTDEGDLMLDAPSMIAGHDEEHGHIIQVREVSDWCMWTPQPVEEMVR